MGNEWQQVGYIPEPNIMSIEQYPEIDCQFRQGEIGYLALDLVVAPDWSKDLISSQVDNLLSSKGVEIWSPSHFIDNTLYVYFKTGAVPLLVIGIIVAGVIGIALISAITIYKLKAPLVEEQVKEATDTYQAFLDAANDLPADQRIAALTDQVNRNRTSLSEQTKDTDALTNMFKQPLLILAILAGIALVFYAFLRSR